MEFLKFSEPNEDSVEERSEGVETGIGARLSVTQSDDPLSGGHFALGMSKMPLCKCEKASEKRRQKGSELCHVPRACQRT